MGRQSTGEVKPQEVPNARKSSEEYKKKAEVSIATGISKETVISNEQTKSGSREKVKDAKTSGSVIESKSLSADAPSFEMRPQPGIVTVTQAVTNNASTDSKTDLSLHQATSVSTEKDKIATTIEAVVDTPVTVVEQEKLVKEDTSKTETFIQDQSVEVKKQEAEVVSEVATEKSENNVLRLPGDCGVCFSVFLYVQKMY